eukprot:8412518-Karenia_brevis.AAC.1
MTLRCLRLPDDDNMWKYIKSDLTSSEEWHNILAACGDFLDSSKITRLQAQAFVDDILQRLVALIFGTFSSHKLVRKRHTAKVTGPAHPLARMSAPPRLRHLRNVAQRAE